MDKSFFFEKFRKAELFAFDLDGTTIIDSTAIDGVVDFLNFLVREGKKICFLTNNSSKTNFMHARHLSKALKMTIQESQVVSSIDSLKYFLKKKEIKKIYPFLNEKVKESLRMEIDFDVENPQMIAIGFNTDATYFHLEKISELIFKGIPYLLVHPDLRCPTSFGYIPDAGAFGKLIELTTQKKPVWIGGKPNPLMAETLTRKFKVDEERIIYVGDRIYTDMEMVRRTKMYGVLVLTGETSLKDVRRYESKKKMERIFVFDNMKEMLKSIVE